MRTCCWWCVTLQARQEKRAAAAAAQAARDNAAAAALMTEMESLTSQEDPELSAMNALLAKDVAEVFAADVGPTREKLEAKRKAVVASVQGRLTTGLASSKLKEMKAILSECNRHHAWDEDALKQDYARLSKKYEKALGAVLCVEGAGTAWCNGYYKKNGAPAPLPSVIANDDDDDDDDDDIIMRSFSWK